MSDKRSSEVTVTNHFKGRVNITLEHRYGDGAPETATWNDLAPGKSGAPLTVHYETGTFSLGMDRWTVRVDVLEGTQKGVYQTENKRCYLTQEDEGTLLTFDVSADGGFKINLLSSSCQADLTKIS